MTTNSHQRPVDRPDVSVVIPARNAALTLQATLKSLADQDFANWEAIIVDDGSTDATASIAESWARSDRRVRCIPGPRCGVSAARNAGIAEARGALVAFLDADDLWLPSKLRLHVAHLAERPDVGVSFARIQFVDSQAQPTGVTSTTKVRGLAAHDYLYENPACTASTLVVRRAVFRDSGAFDESMKFAEDLELLVRIRSTSTWGVEGLSDVLTHYRASPNGASANLDHMHAGWETLMQKVSAYAPEMVAEHYRSACAVHLRYLARRVVRLGLPATMGLRYFGRAVASHPWVLLRDPRRTVGTLAILLVSRVVGPLLSESASTDRARS